MEAFGKTKESVDRPYRSGYNTLMKTVTITQLKDRLSALIDYIKSGETILILARNKPVARMVPVLGGEVRDSNGGLAGLERTGLVVRGKGKVVREILDSPLPKPKRKVSVVQMVLDERMHSR